MKPTPIVRLAAAIAAACVTLTLFDGVAMLASPSDGRQPVPLAAARQPAPSTIAPGAAPFDARSGAILVSMAIVRL